MSAYAPHGGYEPTIRQECFGDIRKHTSHFLISRDLNSRMSQTRPGKDHIVGPYVFGKAGGRDSALANRELLIETCEASAMRIANTFFEHPAEKLLTGCAHGHNTLARFRSVA